MEKRDFKRPRFTLDRSRRGNLTEQIAAGLRTAIETGYYRPGDILPPVRDLAQILGVSMGIAVQAVNRIREAGLISPRPAVGSVVCAKDRPLWKGQVLIVVPSGIGNPSGNAAYAVLRDTLTANGYLPLTATVLRTPDGKFDFSLLETVMRQQLDLVVQLHDQPEIARWLSRKGVPFIRFTQKALRLANCVGNVVRRDDLAVSDFLAHCRREEVSRVLQVAAWSSGLDVAPPLKRLGIDVETWRVPLLKNECTGYALAKWAAETFAEWLTRNGKDRLPDVIFFRDDHLTTGALLAFATAGIRIPEDVRIVTWSNRDYGPVSLFPVTRMEMDVAAQGRALAEHVLTYLRK